MTKTTVALLCKVILMHSPLGFMNYIFPPTRHALPSAVDFAFSASDPMSGRRGVYRITVDVENEPLNAGPRGRLVEVVDYDATNKAYYTPVNLDDPNHLMEDGLANVSIPAFTNRWSTPLRCAS